jgi:hypothetical protein
MAGEYWLAMRADGFKGQGSALDPYDASSPSLFNSLLNKLADDHPNGQVTVHIGPGIFQVTAYPNQPRQWFPRARWRIIGAGRRATVLKVVGATARTFVQPAFQNEPYNHHADGFTMEDPNASSATTTAPAETTQTTTTPAPSPVQTGSNSPVIASIDNKTDYRYLIGGILTIALIVVAILFGG